MRMADILRGGITRNTLYSMRDSGLVVQMARGLYRLAEMAPLSQADLVTVAAKAPQAVTLADCFSRRNEVGLDVAIEALKFYMAKGNVKVDLIMEYATKLRVAKTMRPYLVALL